jgi:hypothetical protein
MSATSFIRKMIYSMPEGGTFTTRDCLDYGKRAAVDQALFRCVKGGLIRRLARGVFAKDPDGRIKFRPIEIATLKAKSFGHAIAKHGSTIAAELGLKVSGSREPIFAIDARSSSFRVGDVQIHLKGASSRKLRLDESKTGRTLQALWHMGKGEVDPYVIERAAMYFLRSDREEMLNHMRWIPSWLCDSFKFTRSWRPAVRVQ